MGFESGHKQCIACFIFHCVNEDRWLGIFQQILFSTENVHMLKLKLFVETHTF